MSGERHHPEHDFSEEVMLHGPIGSRVRVFQPTDLAEAEDLNQVGRGVYHWIETNIGNLLTIFQGSPTPFTHIGSLNYTVLQKGGQFPLHVRVSHPIRRHKLVVIPNSTIICQRGAEQVSRCQSGPHSITTGNFAGVIATLLAKWINPHTQLAHFIYTPTYGLIAIARDVLAEKASPRERCDFGLVLFRTIDPRIIYHQPRSDSGDWGKILCGSCPESSSSARLALLMMSHAIMQRYLTIIPPELRRAHAAMPIF